MAGRGLIKIHCINGHERTPENVDPRNRQCKLCHSAQARERARERYTPRPKKTHCKRGHERTSENLYRGGCYVCLKENVKKRSAQVRQAQISERRNIDIENSPAIASILAGTDTEMVR